MINTRVVSSLEKPFLEDNILQFKELTNIRILKNERASFQLLYTKDDVSNRYIRNFVRPVIKSELASYITMRSLINLPSTLAAYPDRLDTKYLKTTPGLYPDLLQPMHNRGDFSAFYNQLRSLWFELDTKGEVDAGVYPVAIELYDVKTGELITTHELEVKIMNASLPEQEIIVTSWFHCDCLADYYGVEVFSERHWEIIENFVKTAVKNGQTMLLTPTITPAFDTEVGTERPTVQLVDIAINNGEYSFSYDKLDRWVEMCHRNGIKYFELPPFFTQWGAEHAPKIMATVDGEYKKIYGWETDSASEEYASFTTTFVAALIAHLKELGIDKQCYFHMSDEPKLKNLEQYKKSQAGIRKCIEGYHTMDAISNYEFYLEGLIDTPVPATNHIEPFLEGNIPGMWCYYCCSQCIDVSNRFFAMPGARTRCLGMQLFKYNIGGFLQWGYNFYYNHLSRDLINPFYETTGEDWVESGDAFVVYPGFDGKPMESIRLVAFNEALQDQRAMKLCESFYGHDAVVKAIEEVCGEVRFDKCLTASEDMLAVRERINDMIEAKI